MSHWSRRRFLMQSTAGLAALGSGGLMLRADSQPTPTSGDLGDYGRYLAAEAAGDPAAAPTSNATTSAAPEAPAIAPTGRFAPTEDNILGPFHRRGAPYRAKITPPLEPGQVLLIHGQVWGFDTRKPLSGAVLDIWQANHDGRYDNDDPRNPPKADTFVNRARLITDEQGRYEYETILPGRYAIGQDRNGQPVYRPRHIHYLVRHPGYRQLVTQLYFKGDPHNDTDRFIRPSLIIDLDSQRNRHGTWLHGTFDIVLAATP